MASLFPHATNGTYIGLQRPRRSSVLAAATMHRCPTCRSRVTRQELRPPYPARSTTLCSATVPPRMETRGPPCAVTIARLGRRSQLSQERQQRNRNIKTSNLATSYNRRVPPWLLGIRLAYKYLSSKHKVARSDRGCSVASVE
jgi:hypothetical protein